MKFFWRGLAPLAVLTLLGVAVPPAQAADPSPSPTGSEVPQPSYCAQYTQSVPSWLYAGQSATMTVTIKGVQDNARLTPAGSGPDGNPVNFEPASATPPSGTSGDATTQVPFSFTPSDTSTVGINWTDHCAAEAAGRQDRQGSSTPSTVRVVHRDPPPANYACGAPDFYAVTPDRNRVAAGDKINLRVTVRTLPCYGEERAPHYFTVVGRTPGQTSEYPYEVIGEGQTDDSGLADITASPTRDTEYALLTRYSQKSVVTVDRTAGTCAGQLTSSAPPAVAVDSTVRFSGHAPPGSDVTLNLRRRGQAVFAPRAVTLDTSGNWTTTLRADDDYRYYARTTACDSPAGLLTVRSRISGPTIARKGSTVTLTIHAPAGRALGVYFRPAGGTFTLRRTGRADTNGIWVVTYRADRDYRYYAVTTADKRPTNQGLTQVR